MYAGRVVETAEAATLFDEMHHPYTQALLASIPHLNQDARKALHAIPGLPPDLAHPPQGCRFAARCSRATDKCRTEEPSLAGKTFDHRFSCWHPVDGPLALALIGEGGPDAASTGLAAKAAEPGFVADAPLPDAPLAGIEASEAAESGSATSETSERSGSRAARDGCQRADGVRAARGDRGGPRPDGRWPP